jgi:hypothetical protein
MVEAYIILIGGDEPSVELGSFDLLAIPNANDIITCYSRGWRRLSVSAIEHHAINQNESPEMTIRARNATPHVTVFVRELG